MPSRSLRLRKWTNGAFSAVVSDPSKRKHLLIEGDGRSRARVVKVDGSSFFQSSSRAFANHKGIGRAVVTIRGISPDKGVMRTTTRDYQSGRRRVDEDRYTLKDFSRTSKWTDRLGQMIAYAELTARSNIVTFYEKDAPIQRQITVVDEVARDSIAFNRRTETFSGGSPSEIRTYTTRSMDSWTEDIVKNGEVIGKREVSLDPAGRPNGDSLERYNDGTIKIIRERPEIGSREVTTSFPDGSSLSSDSISAGRSSHTTATSNDGNGNITVTDETWTEDDDGQGSTGYSETSVNGKVVERTSSHKSDTEKSSTTVRQNGDGTYTVTTVVKSGGVKTTSRHTYNEETDEEVDDAESGETEEEDNGDDSDDGDDTGDDAGGDDGETSSGDGDDGYHDYGGRSDEELGRLIGLAIRNGHFGGDPDGDGDGVSQRKYEKILGGLTIDALKKGGTGGGRDDSNLGDSLGAPLIDIQLAYVGSYPGMGGHSQYDDPYNPKAMIEFVNSNFSVGGYAAVASVVQEAARGG